MVSEVEKKMIFKLWDKLGISKKNLKYLGLSIVPKDYFFLMQEYLGLPKYGIGSGRADLDGLREYLIKDVNEYIKTLPSPDDEYCSTSEVKLTRIFLERSYWDGVRFKVLSEFISTGDDFVCPDLPEYEDNSEQACQYDHCFHPVISQAVQYIRDKYDIPMNVEWDKVGKLFFDSF
jgi:hypothetical protein